MIYVGIDPGVREGALAIIYPNDRIHFYDLPGLDGERDLAAIVRPWLSCSTPVLARIEEQNIRHNDINVGAVWNVLKLIRHEQMCISVFQALGVTVNRVQPAQWKRSVGLIGAEKTASIGRLIELYPNSRHDLIYPGKRSTKRNHNRADAGLIAYSLKVDVEKNAALSA